MTLTVLSARLTYSGPDRLDVTRANVNRCRKAGKPVPMGAAFAPSWSLLGPVLEARKAAAALLEETFGLDPTARDVAERMERESFAWYVPLFIAEMRVSAGMTPSHPRWSSAEDIAWQWLLSQERVVLCCACTDRNRCHTLILRRDILPKFGAVDGGEVNNGTK